MRIDRWKSGPIPLVLVAFIVLAAVTITLFRHAEAGHETWTYWFFAKVLAQTGEFIVPDRSPIYTLYLNAFRWMGFPTAVAVEHVVTSMLAMAGLIVLFKRWLGLPMATFAALLSLPFLQASQPPVQMLAVSASAWAVAMRLETDGKSRLVTSYSLLLLSWMLRPSYLVFIMLFMAWDLYKRFAPLIWKRGGTVPAELTLPSVGALTSSLFPRNGVLATTIQRTLLRGWPIILMAALLIVVYGAQSPHVWNNAWVSNPQWFPISNNSKSLLDSHFIGSFNTLYVRDKFGANAQADFYFTNDEVFDGADTTLGAIKANPRFVFEQTAKNAKESVLFFVGLSGVPSVYAKLRLPQWYYFHLGTVVFILFGAVMASRAPPLMIFLLCNGFISGFSALIRPEVQDHYPSLVPILIFSATWYGATLKRGVNSDPRISGRLMIGGGLLGLSLVVIYILGVHVVWRASFLPPMSTTAALIVVLVAGVSAICLALGISQFVERARALVLPVKSLFAWAALPAMLVIFSTGLSTWPDMGIDIARDVKNGDIRVLERREDPSPRASYEDVRSVVENCNGLLASDHVFIGTFMDVPVYDIQEIPPFGKLGDPEYSGLNPDRIDCVVVNNYVRYSYPTRYPDYVEPYVDKLKELGAKTYDVPRYGKIVVLEGSN